MVVVENGKDNTPSQPEIQAPPIKEDKPTPPPEEPIQPPTEEKEEKKEEQTEEPKRTITEKVKDPIMKEANFTKEELETKWIDFIKKVEEDSPSLVFILKMAKIESVEGDLIRLSVPYSFHRDKLSEKTCQKNMEAILNEIMGCKVRFETTVSEKATETKNEDKQKLQELASALGGEVM